MPPTDVAEHVAMGRFGEAAMWILVALRGGPRAGAALLDEVRRLDGAVGPGTLYGALARLERLMLVEPSPDGGSRRAYRLRNLEGGSGA